MNQLCELKIEGFKSIQKMEMKFTNRNILIGGNGAGKSNLLSFFEMLQRIKKCELQNYVIEQGGMNALLYNGRKQTRDCYFAIKRDPYMFYGRINAKNTDECYFEQQGLYNYVEQHNYYAADGFPELKDGGLIKQSRVLSDIGLYHFHDTSILSPMKAFCNIYNNIELAVDGSNIAAILYRIKINEPDLYHYIVQIIQLSAPYLQDFVLRANPLNPEVIRLEWKKAGCDIPFGVNQLSDGTLRFICLVTLLCQPEEMKKDIICIDEPELGLHPYAVTIITELMKKYAKKRQIIIATQSADFVDAFNPQDIIVVDNEDGNSIFRRLCEEDLKDWMEDYSLGEIWKKNIIGGRP